MRNKNYNLSPRQLLRRKRVEPDRDKYWFYRVREASTNVDTKLICDYYIAWQRLIKASGEQVKDEIFNESRKADIILKNIDCLEKEVEKAYEKVKKYLK